MKSFAPDTFNVRTTGRIAKGMRLSPDPMNHHLTMYTKPGCHLCERAKQVIQRCQQKTSFTFVEVDISQSEDLTERYGRDIPVILLDGCEIGRHFVRERKLLELLR